MKPVNFFAKPMLCLSVVLLTACASQAKKVQPAAADVSPAAAASAYGDVIARPGQSEVVVENTLPSGLTIFVNGKIEGTVKARSAARIVVPDGNHYIKVQNMAKNGGTSKDVQFYTKSKRFFFKATSPNQFSVYLSRENAYDITAPNTAGGPAAAPDPTDVPISETSLGKDKAAMFNRLDAAVGSTAPAPAYTPAPAPAAYSAPSAPQPAPAVSAPPAPVSQVSAPPPAAQKPAEKSRIAVYVTGDKAEGERKALGTKMLVALVNSGKYIAIERTEEFLAQIDNEQLKQRSGSVDDNQISQLGKQFGVQYVCIANITHAFGTYQVSARIIDVETAVVVSVGEDDSPLRNMDDLTSVSFRIVRALMK
jgi:hypothetical protein